MIAKLLATIKRLLLPTTSAHPTITVDTPTSPTPDPYLVSISLTVHATTEDELFKQIAGICDRYRNNSTKAPQMSHESSEYCWEVKYSTNGKA